MDTHRRTLAETTLRIFRLRISDDDGRTVAEAIAEACPEFHEAVGRILRSRP